MSTVARTRERKRVEKSSSLFWRNRSGRHPGIKAGRGLCVPGSTLGRWQSSERCGLGEADKYSEPC